MELAYWPRPGSDKPLEKITFYTKVGNQDCGVGYYKEWLLWTNVAGDPKTARCPISICLNKGSRSLFAGRALPKVSAAALFRKHVCAATRAACNPGASLWPP